MGSSLPLWGVPCRARVAHLVRCSLYDEVYDVHCMCTWRRIALWIYGVGKVCFLLSCRYALVSPLSLAFDLVPIGSALPTDSPSRGKSGATKVLWRGVWVRKHYFREVSIFHCVYGLWFIFADITGTITFLFFERDRYSRTLRCSTCLTCFR